MNPGLYVVGTPIGNLQDITLRALETLKTVSIIMAEDTRHTHILLDRHGITTPLASCHKFNEAARVEFILERIRNGQAVALVTDSGMPGISDPGARLVDACRTAGAPVYVVPGPSAVTSAVALAGFLYKGFLFEGFLDHKTAARRRRLTELAGCEYPIVLYESPYRLLKLMTEIKETLGTRPIYVGRELTKQFEESLRGTPDEITSAFQHRNVKGELVVIIAPHPDRRHLRREEEPTPPPPPDADSHPAEPSPV